MPTLNDARRFTRGLVLAQLLPVGIIVGSLTGALRADDFSSTVVVLVVAVVLQTVVNVVAVVVTRRADAGIKTTIERCTSELVDGSVPLTAPVPARVVRSRSTRNRTAGVVDLFGRPQGHLQPASRIVVLSVLPPGEPPRRVGLLAPFGAAGMLTRRTIHLVHLHPTEQEAAVLNVRSEPGRLDAAQQDAGWRTFRFPTDRSVAGGWFAATAFGLAGVALGVPLGLAFAAVG